MMKVRILCLFLLGAVGICNGTAYDSYDKEAQAFGKDRLDAFLHAFQKAAMVKKSKDVDDSRLTDPESKYVFKRIRKSVVETILDEETTYETDEAFQILTKELPIEKNIPAFHNKSILLAFEPEVENIIQKTTDPEELKYYWTAWREKLKDWAAQHFAHFVLIMKQHNKFLAIEPQDKDWVGVYNNDEMEKVELQIKPLYNQLHGFIRKQLHTKYGDSVISLNGTIPHHLFEQVLAQVWTAGSIIDDKDLSTFDEILKKNNYDNLKMFKTADGFYQSLGFNPIPDKHWKQYVQMKTDDEDRKDCQPKMFPFYPYFYKQYCQEMDFWKFLQAHSNMGEIYHDKEKNGLGGIFVRGHDMRLAVGIAVILSVKTPKHLETIGLADAHRFTEEVRMNQLLRMGINSLVNMQVYFVHTQLMRDFFDGIVYIADLNKHYWKLMEKYVGVASPVDRGIETYDFPLTFYRQCFENYAKTKFMTEALGYQIYEKLCSISGNYSRSNKSEPINNCDFYGSKEAGNALKKLVRLPAWTPVPLLLEDIFPENPTVNGESLIEYYAPMKSWLANKIQAENMVVGWQHSD